VSVYFFKHAGVYNGQDNNSDFCFFTAQERLSPDSGHEQEKKYDFHETWRSVNLPKLILLRLFPIKIWSGRATKATGCLTASVLSEDDLGQILKRQNASHRLSFKNMIWEGYQSDRMPHSVCPIKI
jgi:hypothetical protein